MKTEIKSNFLDLKTEKFPKQKYGLLQQGRANSADT